MRKFLVVTAALAALGAATAAIGSAAQAQPYGPGMMGGGYGPGYGYGMMDEYGHGYMMGPGYGPGYMMGPGYGYGGRGYGRGDAYRGQRLCWKQTGTDRGAGYYAPCQN